MQPPPTPRTPRTRASILNEARVRVTRELDAIAADWLRGTTTRSTPLEVIDEMRGWLTQHGFALTEDLALADGKKVLGCVGTSAWIDRAVFSALRRGAPDGCATLRVGEMWVSNDVREKLGRQEPFPLLLVHGRDEQVATFRVKRATRVTDESGRVPAKLIEFQLAPWR